MTILSISFLSCQQKTAHKSFVLKSSGYVLAEPDEASIDLNLSCVDKNLERAKSRLVSKANSVSEMLDKLGITKNDILTTSLRLNKDYSWQNGSNVFSGYNASSQLHVVIRNLDILGEFYSRFLLMEDLSIGNLNYQHSKMDSLSNEAYLNALDNANMLADKLLTKLPESNKSIVKVSNVEISNTGNTELYETNMVSNAEVSSRAQMPVSTGNMAVEQTLYVVYSIY